MAEGQNVNAQALQLIQSMIAQTNQSIAIQNPQLSRSRGGSDRGQSLVQTATNTQRGTIVSPQLSSPPLAAYTYKVKIINPQKKSEISTRYLNKVSSRLCSVSELRQKIKEEFGDKVSSSPDFNVEYTEGTQQVKISLVSSDDLHRMYQQHSQGGTISLWYDGHCDGTRSGKRKQDEPASGRKANEQEVDNVYKDLRDKHGTLYDSPKLRLWARMISSGIHDDYDTPPDVPMFSTPSAKKARKEPLSEALSTAAIALAKSLDKSNPSNSVVSLGGLNPQGVSPGKSVDLRMKNYEQLRYLKKL